MWHAPVHACDTRAPGKQKYEGHIKINDSLEVTTDKNKCLYRVKKHEDILILSSKILYKHGYEMKNIPRKDLEFFDILCAPLID